MMKNIATVASVAVCALFLWACGASKEELLSNARSLEVTLMRNLSTSVMPWISQQASNVSDGRADERTIQEASLERVGSTDNQEAGANALTFFVMMDATRKIDVNSSKLQKQVESIGAAKEKVESLVMRVQEDLKKNSGKDDSEPPVCDPYDQALNDLSRTLGESQTWVGIADREPADVGDLKALLQDLEYLRNSLDELSELTTLRLQAIMDRKSKALSTISRVMKSVSETDEGIIRAIK